MAARIQIVENGRVYQEDTVERLWFFPEGSDYLRYSPHFHKISPGGFRANFPLSHGFVVVLEGKLSVKDWFGNTIQKIDVQDQVWFIRGTARRATGDYAKVLRTESRVRHSLKPIYG